MKRLGQFFLWAALFIGALFAVDRFMIQAPMQSSTGQGIQRAYVDFRDRLLSLTQGGENRGAAVSAPERAPGKKTSSERSAKAPAPAPMKKAVRYVYADEGGEIQFADSLSEIPARFRKEAQPLTDE